MKLILLVLLSCSMVTCSIAQNKKEVVKQPISYIQKVPAFARDLMPAQGKSVFWGKLYIKGEKVTKGFHLYLLYAPELKREQPSGNYIQCHFALDVFTLQPKPKLINRVFLVIKGGWAPTTYGMFFTWMNPRGIARENTTPMIVVKSFSSGDYGPGGIESFITFPGGWTNQTDVNNLQFGRWNASNTAGEDNTQEVDSRGLIEIHASLLPTTSELTPEQYTNNYTFSMVWNGLSTKYAPHAENQKVIETYFDPYQ